MAYGILCLLSGEGLGQDLVLWSCLLPVESYDRHSNTVSGPFDLRKLSH